MQQLTIAVVGAGISGLGAAWLLSRRHRVTVFEAASHLGGHANTIDVDVPEGTIAVDTGFIVHNRANYPNLTALFSHLRVPEARTQMSFSFCDASNGYEYSGTGFNGIFGQRRNLARPSHWRMLGDVARFFRTAKSELDRRKGSPSLANFLAECGYSRAFVEHHILPMGAAIWSTTPDRMLAFPARSFVNFFDNHGLMQVKGRPHWHTVAGGSREYVRRMIADGAFEICRGSAVERIRRKPEGVYLTSGAGDGRRFDQVVIATHADQALALLDRPTDREAALLGAFGYENNVAIVHHDRRVMPHRKRVWASWNFRRSADSAGPPCVTYWMNSLQPLDTSRNIFVTLNPEQQPSRERTWAQFTYRHPQFDAAACAAQRELWHLQGVNRTWLCGSYFGHGFHEDGLQAGLAVAEQLGGTQRPWTVCKPSGRIAVTGISHAEAAE